VGKAGLIFLLAAISALGILHLTAHREMHMGGCGPRALQAVASKLGCSLSEAQILALFPGEGSDVSILELEDIANDLGLKACSRQMGIADLRSQHPYGVLHVDNTHFVAVVGYREDSVLIVDSLYIGETEPVRWFYDDLKTRWDGAILIVSRQ